MNLEASSLQNDSSSILDPEKKRSNQTMPLSMGGKMSTVYSDLTDE